MFLLQISKPRKYHTETNVVWAVSYFWRLLSLSILTLFILTEGWTELVGFYFPCVLLLTEDKTSALPVGSKALGQWNSVCLGFTPPTEAFTSSLLLFFFQALFFLLHRLHLPFSFILYICPIQNPQTFLYLPSFFSLIGLVHCVNPWLHSTSQTNLLFIESQATLPRSLSSLPMTVRAQVDWVPPYKSGSHLLLRSYQSQSSLAEQGPDISGWGEGTSWSVPDHFSVKRS